MIPLKTHKIASLALAGAMFLSSFAAMAAAPTEKTVAPSAAIERLDAEFATVMEKAMTALEESDISEDDAYALVDWVLLLGMVYEGTMVPLEDAADADENRNQTEENEFKGGKYSYKTTASPEQFVVREVETYDDGSAWDYKVSYMRKLNRMAAEAAVTEDGKTYTSTVLDYVVGEQRVYIQLGVFMENDKDTGEGIYDVIRVMVGNGEIYANMKQMNEKELQSSRVTSVYPGFAAFAFNEGEVFAYDGKTIAIGDVKELDKATVYDLAPSKAA